MGESPEEDPESLGSNETFDRSSESLDYSNITTTTFPFFFIPKRPRVVKMRDLAPDTKLRLTKEYYEVYDPWTGIRIAATLGILISLFSLFLIYKGKYNRSRHAIIPSKKTSLYLYDEELDCGVGANLGSSNDSGSFAYSFRYGDERHPRKYTIGLNGEDFPLEEVFVKSPVVQCVAVSVQKNRKGSKGPKFGTIKISKEPSRSLPCSPYKQKDKMKHQKGDSVETCVDVPDSPGRESGSITSFGSEDSIPPQLEVTRAQKRKCHAHHHEGHAHKKLQKIEVHRDSLLEDDVIPTEAVLVSKRPRGYRSRSTVVTIGRRRNMS